MDLKSRRFRVTDCVYLAMTLLPLLTAMILKVLLVPRSEGISVSGAYIFVQIGIPGDVIQGLPITESQVNSWLVLISIFFLCLYLTHGLQAKAVTKRQLIAEWLVEQTENLVNGNMGAYFNGFVPFIGAVMAISVFSSFMSLLGLYPPTSDINVVAGWAILVFFLITYYKMKCGPLMYLKSFAEPVPLLTPLNIISEVATPVSMAFRHYGNVLSGSVISVMVAAMLQGLSKLIFGWLPGILGDIPFLQIGVPAVLSVYFDIFSGALQAYIFAMLTMLYVSGAFPMDEYFSRKQKREAKKCQKQQRLLNNNI